MRTTRLSVALAGAAAAACLVAAGCGGSGGLKALAAIVDQQGEQIKALETTLKALDDRSKAQEIRIEQMGKTCATLDADIGAVRNYGRETERKMGDFRQEITKVVEGQNAHIVQIKAAYGAILQQEAQGLEGIAKALETALTDLKAAIAKSIEELKKSPPAPGTLPPLATPKDTTPPPPTVPPVQ